jgi:hypothetical protein
MSSSGSQEPFNVTQTAGVLPNVPYLLEVEGVRKAFPGVVALDGVQLKIRPSSRTSKAHGVGHKGRCDRGENTIHNRKYHS